MTTISNITERVRLQLSGGNPSVRDSSRDAEIREAINSVGATLLKADVLNNLDGETIPDGVIIATYEKIPLTRAKGRAIATLPATPMNMPERMGVFAVYPPDEPENEFDPLPPGIYNLWKEDKLLSPLDNGWYTWDGNKVTIWKDLVGGGMSAVDMKICTVDFRLLGDSAILPIPVDLEAQLVATVVQLLTKPLAERKEGIKPNPDA